MYIVKNKILVDSFEKTIDDMNQLLKNKVLDDKDRKHIQTSSEMFSVMSEKYKKVLDKQKHENEKTTSACIPCDLRRNRRERRYHHRKSAIFLSGP